VRRSLFSREFLGERPVGIITLKDIVAVAIETQRNAMASDHGVQNAQIAKGIFGFELEARGQDLTSGVILKTDQREVRTTTFEPIMTAGIGEHHHAETWLRRPAGAILARPTLLRRRQFRSAQDAALFRG
jgi:hypothetical protein